MTSATLASTASSSSSYSWRHEVPTTASLGRRGAALAVDLVVVVVLAYLLTFVLSGAGVLTLPAVQLDRGLGDEALGFLWLTTLLELPVNLAYFTICEGWKGRTLGKLMMGLRVATKTGGKIGWFDAFLRNLLRLLWVSPFGPAFVFLDAYIIHATEMEQRIGDLAADTIVVVDG